MMSRERKMSNKELQRALEEMAEKHNNFVGYVQEIARHLESLSTLTHVGLLHSGHAEIAKCSACGTEVIYPKMEEFSAHPICPNSRDNEDCLTGFDHIPNPFDEAIDLSQKTLEDFDGNEEE